MANDVIARNAVGFNFFTLQVRDLERSRRFYTDVLGLAPKDSSPPNAQVFATTPIPFAVREASVDLDAVDKLGWGVVMWMKAEDPDALHKQLADVGVEIIEEPCDQACGRVFVFADPDGYLVTVHDR